ncbi:MAG: MFS transporter [SAR202 cluster bacterium]|nr:MFS transporter [SAR202 cluster bacterium]
MIGSDSYLAVAAPNFAVGAPYLRAKRVPVPNTFRAFHNHNYRILWLANFAAYASRWMQMTLLVWFVLERTDSAWLVALVGFFGMAPMFLLGMVGGVLADRADRRQLLIITQSVSFLSVLAMAALLQTDIVRYWHAYPSVMIVGTAWALDMPSRRSLIHDMLGRDGVTNAVALDSAGMSSSLMLGPALAGAMITAIGVSYGYIAVAALYLISLTLLSRLRVEPVRRDSVARVRLFQELSIGLRYVASHPLLRAMVLITVAMNLLSFPYANIVPVIARDVLGVGPGLMGILLAAPGLGSVIGAVIVASTTTIARPGRIFVAGSLLTFVGLALFSVSDWYGLSLAILAMMGLGAAGFGTMQASMTMLVAHEDMRGKALGVVSLAIGAGPFGALLIGGTASLLGPSLALAVNGAIGASFVLLVALLMPPLMRPIREVTSR